MLLKEEYLATEDTEITERKKGKLLRHCLSSLA
jgi:hypothetical protein